MGFDAAMTACVVCDQRLKDLIEVCGTARPPGQHQHANGGPARGDSRLRGGVAGTGRVGRGGHGDAGAGKAIVNRSGMAAMHVRVHMLSQAVLFCCLA